MWAKFLGAGSRARSESTIEILGIEYSYGQSFSCTVPVDTTVHQEEAGAHL